jgi:lantibiotic modifying enzyme
MGRNIANHPLLAPSATRVRSQVEFVTAGTTKEELFPEACIDAAGAIANIAGQLLHTAVYLPGGAVSWRDQPTDATVKVETTQLLSPHVYDGAAGVAFFLAAHHYATNNPASGAMAVRALAPIVAKVLQLEARPEDLRPQSIAIGGFVGLGGILYVLVYAAAWLRDQKLLQTASTIVSLITPDLISRDRKLDVIGGCAGALLALLAFREQHGVSAREQTRALNLAVVCGRHLMNKRVAYRSGARGWSASDCPPLSGFAHGAAGISYALLRLFQHTGDEAFRAAALEGFDFERSLYDCHSKSWLDLRFGRPLDQVSWCHGAPGISLSRLYALSHVDSEVVQKDLEVALEITMAIQEPPSDHLCCGNCGLIEILNTAGVVLEQPEFCRKAYELARHTLARADAGGFRFPDPDPTTGQFTRAKFPPSLFLGSTGIGYTLLRLTYPHRFPCVLTLQ